MKVRIYILLLLLLISYRGYAKEKTPFVKRLANYFKEANVDKTLEKKLDITFIGAPNYSSEQSFGLAVMAAGKYRFDKMSPVSEATAFTNVTLTGFYIIGLNNKSYIKCKRHIFTLTAFFMSMPSDYYGIGYLAGRNNSPTSMTEKQYLLRTEFQHQIFKDIYVGFNHSLDYTWAKNMKNKSYLYGQKNKYFSSAQGVSLCYDSRDLPDNAFYGINIRADYKIFARVCGNTATFNKGEFTANYYHSLWRGAHLAYDIHGVFSWGDVPWTQMATMGGNKRMRGYYEGQFRDKCLLEAQIECRQKIYGRSGIAFWVGAGNVFSELGEFHYHYTLPNFGIGYRWELKKRLNIRLDFGFGKYGQNGVIFSVNEAF